MTSQLLPGQEVRFDQDVQKWPKSRFKKLIWDTSTTPFFVKFCILGNLCMLFPMELSILRAEFSFNIPWKFQVNRTSFHKVIRDRAS